MSLPIVKSLLKKNEKLEKKYKKLKIKNKALQTILYDLSYVKSPSSKIRKIGKLRKNGGELLNNNIVVENGSSSDVIYIGKNINKKENIVYDLVDDVENELNEGFDEDDEEAIEIITTLKNELKTIDKKHAVKTENTNETEEEETAQIEEEEEVEEEEEEEVEEEEEEEVEEEETAQTEEEEEEVEEEEETAQTEEEEEEEETAQTEEEEEEETDEREGASEGTVGSLEPEEEMEVEEVIVNGKKYYTTNAKNGIIYEVLLDDDIGPEIGSFKDGKAKFYKK
jgi:chemotaxis protein histidine kinase CheA